MNSSQKLPLQRKDSFYGDRFISKVHEKINVYVKDKKENSPVFLIWLYDNDKEIALKLINTVVDCYEDKFLKKGYFDNVINVFNKRKVAEKKSLDIIKDYVKGLKNKSKNSSENKTFLELWILLIGFESNQGIVGFGKKINRIVDEAIKKEQQQQENQEEIFNLLKEAIEGEKTEKSNNDINRADTLILNDNKDKDLYDKIVQTENIDIHCRIEDIIINFIKKNNINEKKERVTRVFIEIYQDKLLKDYETVINDEKDKFIEALFIFYRYANSVGFKVKEKLKKIIDNELNIKSKKYINDNSELWHIKEPDSNNKNLYEKCYQHLKDFILASKGAKVLSEHKFKFIAQDELLKAQIEYFFDQANKSIKGFYSDKEKDINKRKEEFEKIMNTIVKIESQRPEGHWLKDDVGVMSLAMSGVKFLRKGELPVCQRLKNIYLEYQLVMRGYNFRKEIIGLFKDFNLNITKIIDEINKSYEDTKNKIYNKQFLTLISSFLSSNGLVGNIMNILKRPLEKYGKLSAHNSFMARALAGNIAQTYDIINNILTNNKATHNSNFYYVLDSFRKGVKQFEDRVYTEAMACYMTEQFSTKECDISDIDEDKEKDLKQMFALFQLFQYMPQVISVMPMLFNGTLHLMKGNVQAMFLDVARGALDFVIADKVQDTVQHMSDETVKLVNLTLMSIKYGPQEALRQMQWMQAASEFMAGQAKGETKAYGFFKTVMRPLSVRFVRLAKAFKTWKQTGNVKPLVIELSKIVLATSVLVGSISFVFFLMGQPLGWAIITGIGLVWSLLCFFYYKMDPLEDGIQMIRNKIGSFMKPGIEKIKQEITEDFRKSIEKDEKLHLSLKKCFVTREVYAKHWGAFKNNNEILAKQIEEKFSDAVSNDDLYKERFAKVEQIGKALQEKESELENRISGNEDNENNKIYEIAAEVNYLRKELYIMLGGSDSDLSTEDLAKKFRNYHWQLAMVNFMGKNGYINIEESMELYTNNAKEKIESFIEVRSEKFCECCINILAMKTARNLFKNNKDLTYRKFDKKTSDEKLLKAINGEFKSMIESYAQFSNPLHT